MVTISARQFGMLVFVLRMGLTIVRLPALKFLRKGPDAWLASLVGSAIGLSILWLVLNQAAKQPQYTLIERMEHSLGVVVGRAVALFYLLFFFWDTMLSTRLYAGLLISQPLPETPTEAFVFMLLFAAAYAAYKGPEVIARLGELVAPFILISIATVLLLAANHMDPLRLQPVVGYGWGQVLVASVSPASVYVEVLSVLMLTPMVREPKKLVRSGLVGALVAGLVTAGAAACLIMFYGAPRTQRLAYPLYDLARAISFGDFFERIDALFIFAWTAVSFVKVAFVLWACAYGLGQVIGTEKWRALVRPLALLGSFLAMRAYASQAEVRALNVPQLYMFIALPFLVLFPALLAVVELFRRPRRRAP